MESEGHGETKMVAAKRLIADFVIGTDVIDALPDAVIVINSAQTIVRANRATSLMFDWPVKDLIGQNLNVLIPKRFHSSHADAVRRFEASDLRAVGMSSRSEICGIKRDGSEVFVEGTLLKTGVPATDGEEAVYLAVILRDVSVRKLAEHQLRLALNETTASSRMKSHFLATMSHELRTPLNAIIGFSELIESETFGPVGDPHYKEYIQDIKESGKHLLEVVSSVLTAARLEADRMEPHPRWVSLDGLVEVAGRQVWPALETRGQTLSFDIDETIEVDVDPLLVKQVFINLLSNACKFSPNGSQIEVVLENLGGRFAVTVVDHGEGIDPKALVRLGRPFAQAHDRQGPAGGIGLGLYIARSYLALHGAALSISSVMGRGTRVRTCWPNSVRRGGGADGEGDDDPLLACEACLRADPSQFCSRSTLDEVTGQVRRVDLGLDAHS